MKSTASQKNLSDAIICVINFMQKSPYMHYVEMAIKLTHPISKQTTFNCKRIFFYLKKNIKYTLLAGNNDRVVFAA